MGGISAQVQQPQTSQPMQSGKGGPVAQAAQQVTDQSSAVNPPNPVQQQSSGKGMASQVTDFAQPTQQPQQPHPVGKGGNYQTSATSGQPRAGMPNNYSNTVGQWDNTQIQQPHGGGKGKG